MRKDRLPRDNRGYEMVEKVERVTETKVVKKFGQEKDYTWFKENFELTNTEIAFGRIAYQPKFYSTPCYYAKIDEENDLNQELNYKLLTEIWKIPEPELVISVHGSGVLDNLISGHTVGSMVREEIYRTAVSTRGWIITNGLNSGVASLIGSARRDIGRELGDTIPLIGIPSWNEVKDKELLLSREGATTVNRSNKSGAQYFTKDSDKNKLEVNHTHQLIFNGVSNSKFRFHLESYIRETSNKWGIPTVNFLISGSLQDLMGIRYGLAERQPLIIMKGSGGAADVVAESISYYKRKLEEHRFDMFGDDGTDENNDHVSFRDRDYILGNIKSIVVNNMLQTAGICSRQGLKRWMSLILDILRNYQDLIILHVIGDSKSSLTKKLLNSVLHDDLIQQLKIAMRLDLVHVVHERLANLTTKAHNNLIYSDAGNELFFKALEENKTDFVKLLIEQKIDLMESEKTTGRIFNLFKSSNSIMTEKEWKTCQLVEIVESILEIKKKVLSSNGVYSHVSDPLVRRRLQPSKTLFIWALMTQKFRMAEIIWTYCNDDGLVLALVASAYCRWISKRSISSEELCNVKKFEKLFEDHAIGVLEIAHTNDPYTGQNLLIQTSDEFGKLSLLDIAVNGRSRAFVAHRIVQGVLNKIWWGRISLDRKYLAQNHIKYYWALLFPFLAHRLLVFDGDYSSLGKLRCFLSSPRTIYKYTVICDILHVLLFAYVLTMNICIAPTVAECILIVWTSTLLVEEVRQINQPGNAVSTKICLWWTDVWNRFDFYGILLFIIAVIYRFYYFLQPENIKCFTEIAENCCPLIVNANFQWIQILYSASFIILVARLLNFYIASVHLGPKVVMLWHMFHDFLFFLYLYIIALIAAGITTQGLLYPNEYRLDIIVYNILFKPIMMLFGEMFLEEVHHYIFGEYPNPNEPDNYCSIADSKIKLGNELEENPAALRCPQYHVFLTIINVFYIFTANILLLNLLIAMFTYSFDRVQKNTEGDMDKYNTLKYKIIREYHQRSPLVPPFSILEGIYKIFRSIFRCVSCSRKVHTQIGAINRQKHIKRDQYRRPMKVYDGKSLENWNYMKCDELMMPTIEELSRSLEHVAVAKYTKFIRQNSTLNGEDCKPSDRRQSRFAELETEVITMQSQNSQFHEKLNRVNKSVNQISRSMERMLKKGRKDVGKSAVENVLKSHIRRKKVDYGRHAILDSARSAIISELNFGDNTIRPAVDSPQVPETLCSGAIGSPRYALKKREEKMCFVPADKATEETIGRLNMSAIEEKLTALQGPLKRPSADSFKRSCLDIIEQETRKWSNSRRQPYGSGLFSTSITRASIAQQKINWGVPFTDYSPVFFQSDILYNGQSRSDSEIYDKSHYDQNTKINPGGRTGIMGRGILPIDGQNLFDYFIVFSDTDRKILMTKSSISASAYTLSLPFEYNESNSITSFQDKLESLSGSQFKIMSKNCLVDSVMNTDTSWIVGRFLFMVVSPTNCDPGQKYVWIDESQEELVKSEHELKLYKQFTAQTFDILSQLP